MKRACLLSVALFAALYAAYAWWLWPRVPMPGPPILAFFGAVGTAMLLSSLFETRQLVRDLSALSREEAGAAMEEGRVEAASGPIVPLGEPLAAPFTGRPCVAYEYEVESRAASSSGDGAPKPATGVALTPSVVKSRRGDVAFLGWALLDEVPKKRVKDDEGVACARAYLEGLAPGQVERLGIGNALGTLQELLADDDGWIRKDWRTTDAPFDPAECRLMERAVPAGETVTVFGRYDSAKGGLGPARTGGAAVNRLFLGGGDALKAKLRSDAAKKILTTLLFFVAFNGMVLAVVLLTSRTG